MITSQTRVSLALRFTFMCFGTVSGDLLIFALNVSNWVRR